MALVRLRQLLECSSVGLEVALWKGSCDMRCTSRCGLLSLPRIFQVAAAGHVPACALSLSTPSFAEPRTCLALPSPAGAHQDRNVARDFQIYASSLRTLFGDRPFEALGHAPSTEAATA